MNPRVLPRRALPNLARRLAVGVRHEPSLKSYARPLPAQTRKLLDLLLEVSRVHLQRINRKAAGLTVAGLAALMDQMRGEVAFRAAFAPDTPHAPYQDCVRLKTNMIRAATNADKEAVTRLVFSVLKAYGLKPDPESTDVDLKDIEQSYQRRGGCFDVLLTEKGKIIGTVAIYPLDKNQCELRKMYLHPSERGKGLGEMLLEHALNQAKALGFSSVILETASVLQEAIGLYRKHGFVPFEADHLAERCDQAYIKQLNDAQQARCGEAGEGKLFGSRLPMVPGR